MWFPLELEDLREICACLPAGRTLFYYERDWIYVMLLEYLLEAGWTAPDIRRSNFARLLEKRQIRKMIAAKGQLRIEESDVLNLYQKDFIAWRLTLGSWGNPRDNRYIQITRRGFNLVLQVNFPEQHNRQYRHYINGDNRDFFNYSGHPASNRELTMAWVRLDVDMSNGEVLIEEIQSDWIRSVARHAEYPCNLHRRLVSNAAPDSLHANRSRAQTCKDVRHYANTVMPEFTSHWQETAIAAAVFFSVRELGIREIFIHDFETGNRLKHISQQYGLPPRSTYTTLPKKFCFQNTSQVPKLALEPLEKINKGKKLTQKLRDPRFWHLSLDRPDNRKHNHL
ncbi:MAG: hypothetical protein AAF423_08690 [Pseudomonadota bacterium]